jgi:hypothetical protein
MRGRNRCPQENAGGGCGQNAGTKSAVGTCEVWHNDKGLGIGERLVANTRGRRGRDGVNRSVSQTRVATVGGAISMHLAQSHSNRGPKGRKGDFADAVRMISFLSGLALSPTPMTTGYVQLAAHLHLFDRPGLS